MYPTKGANQMDKQFDELSKSLAEEGVSRREALKKFGFGLAGVLLAAVGLGGSRSAGAQGAVLCCQYSCKDTSGEGQGKDPQFRVTTCGSTCVPNFYRG